MKISRILLTAVIAGCAFGVGLNATESAKHAKKHYLDEQSISLAEDGIVIETKSGPVRVKTLRTDKNGIYVFKSDCSTNVEKMPYGNLFRKRCSCGKILESYKAWQRHVDSGDCPDHPGKR